MIAQVFCEKRFFCTGDYGAGDSCLQYDCVTAVVGREETAQIDGTRYFFLCFCRFALNGPCIASFTASRARPSIPLRACGKSKGWPTCQSVGFNILRLLCFFAIQGPWHI